jgi:hypothetical protein
MNSFDDIDRFYETSELASASGWQVHHVACPDLARFHEALRNLESSLRLEGVEEKWHPFLSYCRRFRHLASTTPLKGGTIVRQLAKWQVAPTAPLERLKGSLSPESRRFFDSLAMSFLTLEVQPENPLWTAAKQNIRENWLSDAEIAVLYTQTRIGTSLQKFLTEELEGLATCWVLKPSQFKECYTYDQILVFGPTSRHFQDGSEFIYTAPRSAVLTLLAPHFCRPTIPPVYGFKGSPHLKPESTLVSFAAPSVHEGANHSLPINPASADDDNEWLADLPDVLIPAHSWTDRLNDEDPDVAPIRCRQVMLSADHAVFLAEEGGIYRLTRTENSDSGRFVCSSVDYCDVRDVSHGDLLLFQEAGGGSFISEVADQIMGEDAPRFRSLQAHWKGMLKERIKSRGFEGFTRDLRAKGASIDTSLTVRNWCLDDNIGPGTWRNFEILLEALGLAGLQEEIFSATQHIRSAHKSAGFKLAGRLMEMMKGKPLDELEQQGWQEFTGSERMSNRKIAYEVTAVLHQLVEVHPSRIQHPFPIDR